VRSGPANSSALLHLLFVVTFYLSPCDLRGWPIEHGLYNSLTCGFTYKLLTGSPIIYFYVILASDRKCPDLRLSAPLLINGSAAILGQACKLRQAAISTGCSSNPGPGIIYTE
jgi:hypothetical protein